LIEHGLSKYTTYLVYLVSPPIQYRLGDGFTGKKTQTTVWKYWRNKKYSKRTDIQKHSKSPSLH